MKKWYQSKTIWLNFIVLLLAFLPMINEPTLLILGIDPIDSTKFLTILGLITAFLNLLLRMFGGDKKISTQRRSKIKP